LPKFVNEEEIEKYFRLKPRQKLFMVIVGALNFFIGLIGYLMYREADEQKEDLRADSTDQYKKK